ncbi:MAG: hypothetical protein ACQES0_05535 [Bacteroidota bacterium]
MKRIFFILIIALISLHSFGQNEWELQKSEDNIDVFFRQSSEHKYDIKVVTGFNISHQDLMSVLYDIEHYPAWVYRCETATWLNKKNGERVMYSITDIPWPFNDRDIITKMQKPEYKNQKVILRSVALPDYIPPKEGLTRQDFSQVTWIISTDDDKSTRVTYLLSLEITENIPEFILKMITTKGPYESFKNLHNLISPKTN